MNIYIPAFFAAMCTMASVVGALSFVAGALGAVQGLSVDYKALNYDLYASAFFAGLAIFSAIVALRAPVGTVRVISAHAVKSGEKPLESTP